MSSVYASASKLMSGLPIFYPVGLSPTHIEQDKTTYEPGPTTSKTQKVVPKTLWLMMSIVTSAPLCGIGYGTWA